MLRFVVQMSFCVGPNDLIKGRSVAILNDHEVSKELLFYGKKDLVT